jgi:hypothetical protein
MPDFLAGQKADGTIIGTGADGNILAVSSSGFRATYAYRGADIAPATSPTDVVSLVGADGKKIRVTKIGITGKSTAAALVDLYINKRTTANAGGTFTNPTPSIYDSADATPSATIRLYSANPTSLGAGSALEGDIIYLPAAATPASEPTHWERQYSVNGAKCPTLSSAAESININFAGVTLPSGAVFYFYLEWTEE